MTPMPPTAHVHTCRLRNQYFEKPPGVEAPGYYSSDDASRTAWNTEVMCFEKIAGKCRKREYQKEAMQLFGASRSDVSLALIEKDLNLVVYNALIYNG